MRGKKDGNRRLHFASLSHMLAAEGDLSVGAHCLAERALLPSEAFNHERYLTIMDGGPSLRRSTLSFCPKASLLRCSRHVEEDLVKGGKAARNSIPIYKKLLAMPKGHLKLADTLYETLPQDSPLRKIGKEELAPVFLPPVRNTFTHTHTEVSFSRFAHCRPSLAAGGVQPRRHNEQ